MKKRLLSLFLGCLMLFSVAGCATISDLPTEDPAPVTSDAADYTEVPLDAGSEDMDAAAADLINTTDDTVEEEPALETLTYEDMIFDTSYVHEINVEISEEDWADLTANPTDKTKYAVTVTIDGETLSNVSFNTKGNTSLSSVATSDSDRYSFKLNFGKFVDDQTYYGLDKLNLNNLYADSTYLKDYVSYRIMAEAGADAPLVSFVSLSINGELFGLYIAIEEIGDSFLERNYGDEAGELYKPGDDQFDMGNREMPNMEGRESPMPEDGEFSIPEGMAERAQNGEFTPPEGMGEFTMPEDGEFTMPEDGEFEMPQMGGGGGGFGGFGDLGGASLKYTDDEISSYSSIFDNAETNATEEDMQRVIEALKQLLTGEDLESAVDVEAVLSYFAAHNFVLNYDSYTGNMLHNYYLYEQDGVLSILPWDYNLAFGGFEGGSDATSSANWPIDTPLSGTTEEDRPMWGQLIANEEYLELYHEIYDELLTNYFESGRLEKEINALYEMLRPYVESDPTAFYTVEEFDKAVETLKSFCLKRAESIRGQLDGTIPSTTEGQQEDSEALIDASEITMSDMGGMNMGRGGGGEMPNRGQGRWQEAQNEATPVEGSDETSGAVPDAMPEGAPEVPVQ